MSKDYYNVTARLHQSSGADAPTRPTAVVPLVRLLPAADDPRAAERPSRYRPLSTAELAKLPDPEWLIDGLLPTDALGVLYGEPGVGKSFVALDWALCVARGKPWLGHPVRQGDVVYVCAEGTSGLKRRVAAWATTYGPIPDAFRVIPTSIPLSDPVERRELIRAIRSGSARPRMIVIDTLARNFGNGDENQTKDMNAFIAGLDDLRLAFPGVLVLVVHHTGKDQSRGARGSIALQAAVNVTFAMSGVGGKSFKLVNDRQKDADEAADMHLALGVVGLENGTSCVVQRVSEQTAAGKVKAPNPRTHKTDEGFLASLETFGETGATATEWHEKGGHANDTFAASRERLVASGKVRFDGKRYYVIGPDGLPVPEEAQTGSILELANTSRK